MGRRPGCVERLPRSSEDFMQFVTQRILVMGAAPRQVFVEVETNSVLVMGAQTT